MTYLSESGLALPVHDHPTDRTCHWVSIFKPLSFIVFRDARLTQKVLHEASSHARQLDASNFTGYARWLCELGGNGVLNLMNVFLRVCEVQGNPHPPVMDGT
jgi:hypothetical protein